MTNNNITGTYQYIIMGDIIESSKLDAKGLEKFKDTIDEINSELNLLSPLTITLGDEFQGLAHSLEDGINLLFDIEKKLLTLEYPFKIRYALGYGQIITPINNEVAHGMYGQGLTNTREILEASKKDKRRRFDVLLPIPEYMEVMNDLFFVYQSFLDNWKDKDYAIVKEFYTNKDYKEVAKNLDKGSDQIWKREKSLQIREFFDIQDVIIKIARIYTRMHAVTNQESVLEDQFYKSIGAIVHANINDAEAQEMTKRKITNKLKREGAFKQFIDILKDTIIPQ